MDWPGWERPENYQANDGGCAGEGFQAGRKIPEAVTGSCRGSLRGAGRLHGRGCSLGVRTHVRRRIFIVHGATSMGHGGGLSRPAGRLFKEGQ